MGFPYYIILERDVGISLGGLEYVKSIGDLCANCYAKEYRKTKKYKQNREKYEKSEKRKQWQKKYEKLKKVIEYRKKYSKSEKYKNWIRKYVRSKKTKEHTRKYRLSEKYQKMIKKYRNTKKHREYMRLYCKKYYKIEKNRKRRDLASKKYRKSKKYKQYQKQYREKRIEYFRKIDRAWKTIYRKTKKYQTYVRSYRKKYFKIPFNKFKQSVRNAVRNSFYKKGYSKKSRTFEIIGLSYDDFRRWIENQFTKGMTWNNFGRSGWSIDHVIPLSFAKTHEDVVILNNYRNLRPMWFIDNIIKGDKIPSDYKTKLKELGWYDREKRSA